MNVLVISAHPDDEVLGVGGSLARHAQKGDSVFACILCASAGARAGHPGVEALGKHMRRAGKLIGIQDWMTFDFPNVSFNTVPGLELVHSIERAIRQFKPDTIYTHHWSDVNIDHKAVCEATIAAVRLPERGREASKGMTPVKRILAYEVPSSTDWCLETDRPFTPNVYADISKTFDKKMAALREYEGVLRTFPSPCSEEGIRAQAQVRGMACMAKLAEAFVLMREIC